MQHHDSTVAREEVREAIAKVTALAGYDGFGAVAARCGSEVVRMPSNANADGNGSTQNTKENS